MLRTSQINTQTAEHIEFRLPDVLSDRNQLMMSDLQDGVGGTEQRGCRASGVSEGNHVHFHPVGPCGSGPADTVVCVRSDRLWTFKADRVVSICSDSGSSALENFLFYCSPCWRIVNEPRMSCVNRSETDTTVCHISVHSAGISAATPESFR